MKFVSTRGDTPQADFGTMLMSGPAPDGGLYMPESWPRFGVLPDRYAQAAETIMRAFGAGDVRFDDTQVMPLVEIKPGFFLLELFHGPTFAFKDIALQAIARLMERELERRGGRALVLGATSGDTGAAAIAALAERKTIAVVVLHPKGRISEIQRRQMTTCEAPNVRNIAIEGDFDETQRIVRDLFADRAFARAHSLAAMNSLNFARIAAQSVYFMWAAVRLGKPPVFAVPSGNFGNAFSGFCAREMGAAMGKIVVATNENDTLARALETGRFEARRTIATSSPAMDIQKPSNFERLLFEASGRDGARVSAFARGGVFDLSESELRFMRERYIATRVSETETLAAMKRIYEETGRLVDPHTAVGIAAAEKTGPHSAPVVALATAHPAKFPETVMRATGVRPKIPAQLTGLMNLPERYATLPPETAAVKRHIEAEAKRIWH